MRMRKWLFMLGFECKSLISTVMEFFKFVPRQVRFIDMLGQ
jgi:hypothetical protein